MELVLNVTRSVRNETNEKMMQDRALFGMLVQKNGLWWSSTVLPTSKAPPWWQKILQHNVCLGMIHRACRREKMAGKSECYVCMCVWIRTRAWKRCIHEHACITRDMQYALIGVNIHFERCNKPHGCVLLITSDFWLRHVFRGCSKAIYTVH